MTAGAPPPRAGRREWIGLAVIALPCLLYSMDLTVLNLAVPHLSADLKPSSSQLLWIVDIYGFLVAGSLITMGTLDDRIGRRRLLMIGAAAFGAASVLTAFSTSAEMLIATDLIVGSAPVERAGAASAISETSSELGGALGIAIFGSIGTAIYRLAMWDAVPGGLPPEATEAARSTLGGAVAVAGQLPGQLSAQLLGTARAAFTRAFELTAAISAAVSLLTTIGVLVLLRGVRGG